MKTTILFLTLAFLSGPLYGTDFEVDFSRDDVGSLFDPSSSKVTAAAEGKVMLPTSAETRVLPVVGGRKYKLEMQASVDGDFVVEKNERAHILTLQSHLHRLASTYSLIFLDAGGNEVAWPGQRTLTGFFLTNASHPYTAVFYAPEGATALKVRFHSNGRPAALFRLRLVPEDEEGSINPNPDFRYGELSYCGWSPLRDGRLHTRPDGKTVLNSGHLGTSPAFPMQSGRTYRFSARGEGANINIQYYDKDGKRLISRFLFAPSPGGVESEVVPPEGTVMARAVMSGVVVLEEFRVVEIP